MIKIFEAGLLFFVFLYGCRRKVAVAIKDMQSAPPNLELDLTVRAVLIKFSGLVRQEVVAS
jgi:hypothetical protein